MCVHVRPYVGIIKAIEANRLIHTILLSLVGCIIKVQGKPRF